jgi:hypothetical protein
VLQNYNKDAFNGIIAASVGKDLTGLIKKND